MLLINSALDPAHLLAKHLQRTSLLTLLSNQFTAALIHNPKLTSLRLFLTLKFLALSL